MAVLPAVLMHPAAAHADVGTSGNGGLPRTATARLDFTVNIDKYIFFRVGAAPWPTLSGAVSNVGFVLAPSIPPTPVTGNNTAVNWNGAAPAFNVSASGNVLPVEVRSNGGQVSLRAQASAALSSGANSIPLSEILIASNNANLPAPVIPDSGAGPSVNVPGTAFGNLVTVRQANWTFTYANTAPRPAGTYNGQVTFTATIP